MEPLVALIRRYWSDYLTQQDVTVLDELLEPEYVLRMGGEDMVGREAFKAAALAVFDMYPTIELLMHDIVTDGEHLAALFSERTGCKDDLRRSAMWDAVALFKWNGSKLTSALVEQDFMGRREQLRSGVPRTVQIVGASPWGERAGRRDPDTESAAAAWLRRGDLHDATESLVDGMARGEHQAYIETLQTEINLLFSAGARAAFHITQSGRYVGGFDEVPAAVAGRPAVRHAAGVLHVHRGVVAKARIATDRLDLERRLRHETRMTPT